MKKNILIVFLAIVAVDIKPVSAACSEDKQVNSINIHYSSGENKLTQSEVDQLYSRLKEIRAMNVHQLSKAQKHALRKEVLAIQERVSDPWGGGVYISAGMLILIIILLIIFL